jgi:uncharacterized protein
MPSLQQMQREFTAHIREPGVRPRPAAIEERRMQVYNELVFNTIEGLVSLGFPVLRGLLATTQWRALIKAFVVRHRCETPYFLQIGQEFLEFLAAEGEGLDLPVFALELAHYEWVELALDISQEQFEEASGSATLDIENGIPQLSPLAWPLVYRFPVHRISPGFQPSQPGEQAVCLVVYRNRADEVCFLESNPVTHRLLELMSQEHLSGRDLVSRVAGECGAGTDPQWIDGGLQTLRRLSELDIVSGIRCVPT